MLINSLHIKIKSFLCSKRDIGKDIGLNAIAFGLYIAIQQIILMPVISQKASEREFAQVILFITVFNIICNVLGEELGNTRIVRFLEYKGNNIDGDFCLILLSVHLAIIVLGIVCKFMLLLQWIDIILYLVITISGVTRLYSISYFKVKQDFKGILLSNLFYGIGSIIGVIVIFKWQKYLIPFLMGDLFSLAFLFKRINTKAKERFFLKKTPLFKKTVVTYWHLGTITLLLNLVTYLDRILILPILGSVAMAVYYSTSAVSKMISMVINPVSGVLLSRLISSNGDTKDKITNFAIKAIIPLVIVIFIVSIFVTYLGVRLLYAKFLSQARELLIPIGLATSFSVVTFLLKPVMIKFFNTASLLKTNLLYATIFSFSMYFFSRWWGISGFAWASAFARSTQLLFYLLILKKNKRELKSNAGDETRSYSIK